MSSFKEMEPLIDQICDVVLHMNHCFDLELQGRDLMRLALETYVKMIGEMTRANKPMQTVKIEWPGVKP